ncbi:MAG: hypothetical protein ACI8P5_002061, partial [Bacteroidia bacterium]
SSATYDYVVICHKLLIAFAKTAKMGSTNRKP